MKYSKQYKKGFEHLVNKKFMKLSKPTKETKLFYFFLLLILIFLGFLIQ